MPSTFSELKTGIWAESTSDRPPATRENVARASVELGVRLSDDFAELLMVRNGGQLSDGYRAHPAPPNSWASDHVPITALPGIGGGPLDLLRNAGLLREWGMPSALVLLDGDGHSWVALDYRSNGPDGEPTVTWYDSEVGEDIVIAPTFRSFVEQLGAAPPR